MHDWKLMPINVREMQKNKKKRYRKKELLGECLWKESKQFINKLPNKNPNNTQTMCRNPPSSFETFDWP